MYVFLDTEFSNFIHPDLISIGFVSEDGKHEFYREISDYDKDNQSEFVTRVVVPLLDGGSLSKPYDEVVTDLIDCLNQIDDSITIVSDWIGDGDLLRQMLDPHWSKIKPYVHLSTVSQALPHMIRERGFHSTSEMNAAFMSYQVAADFYFTIDDRQHHALVDAKSIRSGWVSAYNGAKNASS
jgi:hypothetical protein